MKHVADLVGVQEVFLIRAINHRITTRTTAQQAAMSVHRRFMISLALHDLVHEVPLAVVAEKFGTSKGLLQSLQLSAGGFAGMVTTFCQKLGWSNLELLFAQFQSRLVFGVERELCGIIRVSLLSNYQARTLYNAGYHTLTTIASANISAIEVCLRTATPFHCARAADNSPDKKSKMLKERLTEAELIIKEAQKIISSDIGIPIETWQAKLPDQSIDVESSKKTPSFKRSPSRETRGLKKMRLQLTPPDVTSTTILNDIPPQAQSTPSLNDQKICQVIDYSRIDHSAQITSPEQVMAQSPLLIDEGEHTKEDDYSEVMFGEVSSTSCNMSVELVTPQLAVADISVVAESPLHHPDLSQLSHMSKPVSSVESEDVLTVDNQAENERYSKKLTKSNVLNTAVYSHCCITVKKVVGTDVTEELMKLQSLSVYVVTKPTSHGIGDGVRGCKKEQQLSSGSITVPVLCCEITGLVFYGGGTLVYFLSVQTDGNLRNIFSEILGNGLTIKKTLVAFYIQRHVKLLLSGLNIDLSDVALLDPSVAHWLTNPDGKQLSLQDLVHRYLPEITNISLQNGSREFPLSVKGNSSQLKAISECVLSFLLMTKLENILVTEELYHPLVEIEMPSMLSLAKMELNGIGMCQQQCALYKKRLQDHLRKLELKAHKLAQQKFSLSSPGEIARVLFINLKLPVDGRIGTKSGYSKVTTKQLNHISTCKEVLEKLTLLHPLPAVIMEWRTVALTLSTVVSPLERETLSSTNHDMVRVYATCHTHTATGRVTIAKPNLQSVPRDYKLCYEGDTSGPLPEDQHTNVSIRNLFIATKGCVLLSADYSQLELRMMAHLSGDRSLQKALTSGQDVFKVMASDWLGIPLSQLTDQHRQQAKSICYGLMYGMGTKSLAVQLKISESEAVNLVETFKNCYPGVKSFISDTIQSCKTKGYVVTMSGRKRFLPAIHSVDKSAQGQAERQAVNTVIQGSAADLVKMAMINIDQCMSRSDDCSARLVLQLHDELLYECAGTKTDRVVDTVCHEMTTAFKGRTVEFPVKVKVGRSWGTLQAIT